MPIVFLAVAHFKAGKNRARVARMLNVSRAMVNDWVAHYLKGGISALKSKKSPGRPCRLTDQQKEALALYIEQQRLSTISKAIGVAAKRQRNSAP
jgi:transposase